ncbi:hypothetical protein MYXA107069_23205 [Myxococcus xanthus]
MVNTSGRASSRTWLARGSASPTSATNASVPHNASSIPSTPPARDSTRLSVRNCATSRPRLAPSAARMDTSRPRAAIRANSRLATLLHAASSTKPTAPSNSHSVPRTLPTTFSSSDVTEKDQPTFRYREGTASSISSATRARSVRAASCVTPGFNRPTTDRNRAPRWSSCRCVSVGTKGTYISAQAG